MKGYMNYNIIIISILYSCGNTKKKRSLGVSNICKLFTINTILKTFCSSIIESVDIQQPIEILLLYCVAFIILILWIFSF